MNMLNWLKTDCFLQKVIAVHLGVDETTIEY